MSRLRNLASQVAALVLGASASIGSLAQTTLKFGEGAGEVTLPAHYAQVEDRDASLVVLSKPEGNVKRVAALCLAHLRLLFPVGPCVRRIPALGHRADAPADRRDVRGRPRRPVAGAACISVAIP